MQFVVVSSGKRIESSLQTLRWQTSNLEKQQTLFEPPRGQFTAVPRVQLGEEIWN